jgi:hypothetical protein
MSFVKEILVYVGFRCFFFWLGNKFFASLLVKNGETVWSCEQKLPKTDERADLIEE